MKNVSYAKMFAGTVLAGVILTLCATASAQTAAPGLTAQTLRTRSAQPPVVESVQTGQVIAPDGKIAITSIDRKWDRVSGTGTINEAAVTRDGKISSRAANLTRDPSGTIITKGTFTDFDGRSSNYTETTKQTAAGPVVVGQLVDEDGKSATYETTSARAGRNQTKLTTVIKYANGAKATRVEILDRAKPVAGS